MTTPCAPTPSSSAQISDPCAYLPALRAALYQLMGGQAQSEIRFGDQWLKFHAGNVRELRAEIRKLEAQCGAAGATGAMRAGPYVPPGRFPTITQLWPNRR